jgi:uncharacterized protein YaaN involved in tellurite resistance
MQNALRIQAALAKQKAVENAVKSFQDGLGDMMAQNAAAVNQAAQNIGDLYNNPVIGLEKLEQGFDQLMQAVSTANRTMAESTTKAREVSERLRQMTQELEPVATGLHQARQEAEHIKQSIAQDPDAYTLKSAEESADAQAKAISKEAKPDA